MTVLHAPNTISVSSPAEGLDKTPGCHLRYVATSGWKCDVVRLHYLSGIYVSDSWCTRCIFLMGDSGHAYHSASGFNVNSPRASSSVTDESSIAVWRPQILAIWTARSAPFIDDPNYIVRGEQTPLLPIKALLTSSSSHRFQTLEVLFFRPFRFRELTTHNLPDLTI